MFLERDRNSYTLAARYMRAAAVLFFAPAFLLGATNSTTQTLSASVAANGKLSVPASLTLSTVGSTFVAYSGSLTVSYLVRTTASTGNGSITMTASADFGPAGGPSISSGQLTYLCSGANLGTACSGPLTVSTSSQTNVVTIGAGVCTGGGAPCSASNPNSVQTTFTLSNNPAYKTGTYSATLTFTISAI